ncbi:hypothetical protein HAX54_033384 [Datura stramonium]|uniref:Uncharacterized protein n=1 Tax=Datura stramonium TaxID=4076 RepID=A0ABS8VC93_DATST|nr:hypothetical protein [Datura stramonium]
MRDQETDREGMAYQSLVDLPLNQSRSSQLSCLGSGIPSLVGAFDSKNVVNRIKRSRAKLASLFKPAALLSIFCQLLACSTDLRGFLSPGKHVYSRWRLQSLSQGQDTPEDQQSSPVSSLPVASSNSGSLSQLHRSSKVSYPVEGL